LQSAFTLTYNNKLTFSIKDEGIGIAEEDMEHMCTSSYRGKNAVNIISKEPALDCIS
jgi:signal transduction histidine kinase